MKNLQIHFTNQDQTEGLSAYTKLFKAVKGRKFSRFTIKKHFHKLVPREDFERTDSDSLIDHLYKHSNMTEEV